MVILLQYQTSDGKIPFENWFESLGATAAVKIRTAIAQIEAGNFGDHKSVGGGVWERRIHFERGYRLYYAMDGKDVVLLLCGGTKTRQQNDIARAQSYWDDYKLRKRDEQKQDDGEDSGPTESKRKKR